MAALGRRYETVVHALVDAVARAPAHDALVFAGHTLSYRDYGAAVAALAHRLQAVGAAHERVAIIHGNAPAMAIALFAAQAAGAQAVPLNPLYTRRELAEMLADAAPIALLYGPEHGDMAAALAGEFGIAHAWRLGAGALAPEALAAERRDWPALPRSSARALIQYTGGTSGRPKGVDIRHGEAAVNLAQYGGLANPVPGRDRILCVMPMFHSYALHMCIYFAVYCRASLVILPRYRPDDVLGTLARERITVFPGAPTIYIGLMSHPAFARTDFSALERCYSGSAALPEETLNAWEAATGAIVLEGYGQSEAGPVLTFNPADGTRKPGSVGLAVADTVVQVVDPETGTRILAPGETGEIRARGPQIMQGYRNRPEETRAALRDGWLYTGDIGAFDADGYLFIRGRKKEMAIVGGYNVYPREVDEVLAACPGVAEAAATGIADAYRGEVICAAVVAAAGAALDADTLIAHCRTQLAPYKVPVRIALLDALPKTSVGKLDRAALRALLSPAPAA